MNSPELNILNYLKDSGKNRGKGETHSDIIESLWGKYLAALIIREWENLILREKVLMLEHEHGTSLSLLFTNESQKIELQKLNQKLTDAAFIHEMDLQMAESVQRSLLFSTPPKLDNYKIAFYYQPFASVSGDFYDFFIDNDNSLQGIVLADVSGHGIASSLLTTLAKPIFFRIFRSGIETPLDQLMEKINSKINDLIYESEHYLTGVMLRFKGSSIEYVNAAHPDIFLKEFSTGRCIPVTPEGGPIQGSLLGIPSLTLPFKSYNFDVKKNDILLLYTDCLNESKNIQNEEFGQERILQVLDNTTEETTPDALIKTLIENFKTFTHGCPLRDDMTIIAIKKK